MYARCRHGSGGLIEDRLLLQSAICLTWLFKKGCKRNPSPRSTRTHTHFHSSHSVQSCLKCSSGRLIKVNQCFTECSVPAPDFYQAASPAEVRLIRRTGSWTHVGFVSCIAGHPIKCSLWLCVSCYFQGSMDNGALPFFSPFSFSAGEEFCLCNKQMSLKKVVKLH